MVALAGQRDDLGEGRRRDGRQRGVDVLEGLAAIDARGVAGVNDALARRPARQAERERGHVEAKVAAAAGAALVVAGDAGTGVEDRAEAVAVGAERVVRLPLVDEQRLAGAGEGGVDVGVYGGRAATRAGASRRAIVPRRG